MPGLVVPPEAGGVRQLAETLAAVETTALPQDAEALGLAADGLRHPGFKLRRREAALP